MYARISGAGSQEAIHLLDISARRALIVRAF
jgi:hypothetical protein